MRSRTDEEAWPATRTRAHPQISTTGPEKSTGEVPDVEQGASPAATFQVSRYVASSAALETFGRA